MLRQPQPIGGLPIARNLGTAHTHETYNQHHASKSPINPLQPVFTSQKFDISNCTRQINRAKGSIANIGHNLKRQKCLLQLLVLLVIQVEVVADLVTVSVHDTSYVVLANKG